MQLTTFAAILSTIASIFFYAMSIRACSHADRMFSLHSSRKMRCRFDGKTMPAHEVAFILLCENRINTSIIRNDSQYADSYIEPLDTIALSEATYFGTGASEIATAAHEIGHATGYGNRFAACIFAIGSSASSTARNLAKALVAVVAMQLALILFADGNELLEYAIVILALLMSICELIGCSVSIESERDASDTAIDLLRVHVSKKSMRSIRGYLSAALDTYLIFAPCVAFGVLAIICVCLPILL